MPTFGQRSRKALDTCDDDIQMVLEGAIKHVDFSIIWGWRGMEEQNEAFNAGRSRNRWPTSKHNATPSIACDIVPYPGGYDASYKQFFEMATYILAVASELGVSLRWGGHWKNYTGQGEYDRDWAHFEKLV